MEFRKLEKEKERKVIVVEFVKKIEEKGFVVLSNHCAFDDECDFDDKWLNTSYNTLRGFVIRIRLPEEVIFKNNRAFYECQIVIPRKIEKPPRIMILGQDLSTLEKLTFFEEKIKIILEVVKEHFLQVN